MGDVADLDSKRDERDAEKWQLLQAIALLELFERAHDGRAASDIKELEDWLKTADLPPGPVDPMEILGPEGYRAAAKSLEDEAGQARAKRIVAVMRSDRE